MFSKTKEVTKHAFLQVILVNTLITVGVAESRVIISSNLTNGDAAYDGQVIVFSCVSSGPIVVWSSDDYIGTGGQELRLSFVDSVGQTESSSVIPDTFARLVSVTDNNGEAVITSELQIQASLANDRSSITCTNNSVAGTKTITFNVASSMVALTSNLNNNVAYHGQMITFRCVSRGTLHIWSSSEYIGTGGQDLRLSFVDPHGQTATSAVVPETVARLISVRDGYSGAPLMESELQIMARRMRRCSVSCSNNGIGALNTTIFGVIDRPRVRTTTTKENADIELMTNKNDDTSTDAAMTVGEVEFAEASSSAVLIGAVTVAAAIVLVVFTSLLSIFILKLHMRARAPTGVQDNEKGSDSSPSDRHFPKNQIPDSVYPVIIEEADYIQNPDSLYPVLIEAADCIQKKSGYDRASDRKESSSSEDSSDKSLMGT